MRSPSALDTYLPTTGRPVSRRSRDDRRDSPIGAETESYPGEAGKEERPSHRPQRGGRGPRPGEAQVPTGATPTRLSATPTPISSGFMSSERLRRHDVKFDTVSVTPPVSGLGDARNAIDGKRVRRGPVCRAPSEFNGDSVPDALLATPPVGAGSWITPKVGLGDVIPHTTPIYSTLAVAATDSSAPPSHQKALN